MRVERRNPFRSSLIIEPLWRRFAIGGLAVTIHCLGFIPLYQESGIGVSALSIFPVVVVAWLFGAWGGLFAGLLAFPLNALLLILVGESGFIIMVGEAGVEASALVVVVGCVIGLLRDLGVRLDRTLTEWRRAERALRETEDRYRVLFERSQDALYVSRPDGTLVEANERFLEMFGYSRVEAGAIRTEVLYVDHEDRERFQSTVDREGFVLEFPVRLKHKNGQVLDCIITATARQDMDQRTVEYQGIIRDVSASKPLHALADRRTRELRDATSELETFTLTVSHDLRTHLVTMGGFASMLWAEHRESLNEEGQEFLRRIVAAGRRMDAFIEDLLGYARVRSAEVELERVELDSLVKQTLTSLEAQIGESHAHIEVSDDLPAVVADKVLLARVLENLVLNAVKYVHEGAVPSVTISADEEGGRVRLKVKDEGIGIPADRLAGVFRAFDRVEPRAYPGTGVGLTVVQKAVQRMAGDVGVRSTPGEGSTFWVLLRAAGPPDLDEVDD